MLMFYNFAIEKILGMLGAGIFDVISLACDIEITFDTSARF